MLRSLIAQRFTSSTRLLSTTSRRLLQTVEETTTATLQQPQSQQSVAATIKKSSKKEPLEYYVRRTKSKLLPVYTEIRNGNTRHLTIIRRVDGSARALARDILQAFPDMTVSGRYTRDICQLLEKKGF
ncbi:hypothetical protein BDF22DRAFT_662326 [Syncephalis plumigaleata]|nr:hypothetical protein BDF22DRAFT_662326 [Syncephalis plumigaleata]